MGEEIEKKYRLTAEGRQSVLDRLTKVNAQSSGKEFEENTLYSGGSLIQHDSILRLRRVAGGATLTFKQGLPGKDGIKRRREHETEIQDFEAMDAILRALGLTPALVYEKRRETWHLEEVELVIDELPFGLFMEIEGAEEAIYRTEHLLEISGLEVEHASYPQLTLRHGERANRTVESRFKKGQNPY
jgi:adenylate cyclase class 2